MQDPKTSRWLWDIRERFRQKRRTEHYREIMKMQQTMADPLLLIADDEDSSDTKAKKQMLTRLTEPEQMENYLSYGKWDLDGNDIERLQKDDEMRQRVSIPFLIRIHKHFALLMRIRKSGRTFLKYEGTYVNNTYVI